ncbi:MAG: hypothetical protein ACLFS4_08575, partial [Opitutales bacterium]
MSDMEVLLNMGFLSDENGVSDETRRVLAGENYTEIVAFSEDTTLITQYKQQSALYFTLEGVFHATSHANPDAPNRLLGRIEAGQFIGEVCFIDSAGTATASVKTQGDAMALKTEPPIHRKSNRHPSTTSATSAGS